MRTYEVRNKQTKMVLGEVRTDDPDTVIADLAHDLGISMERLANKIGTTIDDIAKGLDVIEIKVASKGPKGPIGSHRHVKGMPQWKRRFYADTETA